MMLERFPFHSISKVSGPAGIQSLSGAFPWVFLHWVLGGQVCWVIQDGFLAFVLSLPSPPSTGFPVLYDMKTPQAQIPGPLPRRLSFPRSGLESEPCQSGLGNASALWLGHLR